MYPGEIQSTRAGAATAAVVKLGGSLAGSPLLLDWLRALRHAGPAVVVPGGGPFADAVREAQRRWEFDDGTAHRMALAAMDQMGLMLAALERSLRPAEGRAALLGALARGEVPVWLPSRMAVGRQEIPESWEVTSDSLAAWLAGQLGARRLLLVKSAPLPPIPTAAGELARRGIVDPALPGFLVASGAEAWCVEAARHAGAAAALRGGGGLGTRILSGTEEGRRRGPR